MSSLSSQAGIGVLIGAALIHLCGLSGRADIPAAAASETTLPVKLDLSQFKLSWQDEFDGDQLDTTKWQAAAETRQGTSRWDPALIAVKDGLLRLGIKKLSDPVIRYACSGIRTQKDYDPSKTLFAQTHGYFEVRCKLLRNNQADYWGAFWMMAGRIADDQGDTRQGVEIDILETFAFVPHLEHALTFHWNGYGARHNAASVKCGKQLQVLDGKFHTFGLYWDENIYITFVDGIEVGRTRMTGLGHSDRGRITATGTCRQPGYLLLSTEAASWAGISSNWENNMPDDDEFIVDYVRVYTGKISDTTTLKN